MKFLIPPNQIFRILFCRFSNFVWTLILGFVGNPYPLPIGNEGISCLANHQKFKRV